MAVRTASRPMPAVRTAPALARGFVFTLLLVVCTVSAAYGGYVVGTRTQPAEPPATAQIGDPVEAAVAKAVAAQKKSDRAKRRAALRDFAIFQRERFAAELQRKLSTQHMADGQAAARAYSRGKKAGVVQAREEAAEKAAQIAAAAGTAVAATGDAAATDDAAPPGTDDTEP